jgi:hypothetical protein
MKGYTKEKIIEIVNTSNSISDVLHKIGYAKSGAAFKQFLKFSKDNSLEDMVFNILNSNLDEDNKELIIKRLINII